MTSGNVNIAFFTSFNVIFLILISDKFNPKKRFLGLPRLTGETSIQKHLFFIRHFIFIMGC